MIEKIGKNQKSLKVKIDYNKYSDFTNKLIECIASDNKKGIVDLLEFSYIISIEEKSNIIKEFNNKNYIELDRLIRNIRKKEWKGTSIDDTLNETPKNIIHFMKKNDTK